MLFRNRINNFIKAENSKYQPNSYTFDTSFNNRGNNIQDNFVITKCYKSLDTFHRAIWPILLISQFFAIMPLHGLCNANPKEIKFKLLSISTFTTISFLFTAAASLCLFVNMLIPIGITPKSVVPIIFFSNGLVSCILFMLLAKKWPNIIRYWTKIDIKFLSKSCYKPTKIQLKQKIRIAAATILILAICEHIFFTSSDFYIYFMNGKYCNGSGPAFDDYMYFRFKHIFNVLGYNRVFAMYMMIINISFTFIWNFMDFFIMMVSIGLAIRFEQFNERLRETIKLITTNCVWSDIRGDYIKLLEFLEYVDDEISLIVLLSCINNLYFICIQLLNIFTKLKFIINYIYFWYSLMYLIGRTIVIFLCAASINDQAMLPLKILRNIPTRNWNSEVERFILDLISAKPALSGKKFFFITRNLLFKLAGTLITYELVLLQFDTDKKNTYSRSICD